MIDQLEQEVRSRIDVIEASLTTAEQTADVSRFLRSVGECSASNIRQAPAAAQRALAKTKNPDIGIAQLVHVVEEDPTLGQALLRYANSAYYSTGSVVVSLRQAAQRVGSSGVHNIVLGVMMDGMLCRPGGEFQAMVDQVRSHLVRTAPIARAIARSFAVPADECFAIALLHDAGKLIVFDIIGTLRHEQRREVAVPHTVVSRVLKEVHELLGGLAALHWGLGEEVAVPISAHHRTPVPEKENRMTEVLFVAERLDHALRTSALLDFERWWNDGSITADVQRVEEQVNAYTAVEFAA